MIDSPGMVDEHDETLGPDELECKHLNPWERPLDRGRDLPKELLFLVVYLRHPVPSNKNGRRAPISPNR